MKTPQPRDYSTIEDFIEQLKYRPEILGILQYGNRDYLDMTPGGDYDLIVIVDQVVSTNVDGLHFHINHIPVDCGLIAKEDLHADAPPSDFHCLAAGAKILYDASGEIAKRMPELKKTWGLEVPKMKEGEIAFERFIRQHIIDKFKGRGHEDETYTRIFLSGNVFSLLESYMQIEQLNPYDFKGALRYMKANDLPTYQCFAAFEKTYDLQEKIKITEELNQLVLRKIGGPWQKGEVVFHYREAAHEVPDAERNLVIDLIFGR